jgi:hypothetical protein
MKLSLILLTIFIHVSAFGGTVAPSPHESVTISTDAIPDGVAGVYVNASCYGTNNRGTTNPLSPNSRIVVYLSNSDNEQLLLDFPAVIVATGGTTNDQDCGVTKIKGNTVAIQGGSKTIAELLQSSSSGGKLISDALSINNLKSLNNRYGIACKSFPINYPADYMLTKVTDYYAIQVFNSTVSPESFYGFNGKMDRGAKVSINLGTNNAGQVNETNFLTVNAQLPGQDGFCGGYHSPLMFFFQKEFPSFLGTSTLIKGKDLPTFWVEANHEGYFLVHLKKADEEITVKKLFGDNDKDKNGFEVLKKLDSNKDGVLNKKDKEFKNLYLWKDANGNSINDKGESVKLSDLKVESIDLNYNDGYHLDKGSAVFKGRSTFKFTGDDKKSHEGEIFDIFFANKK